MRRIVFAFLAAVSVASTVNASTINYSIVPDFNGAGTFALTAATSTGDNFGLLYYAVALQGAATIEHVSVSPLLTDVDSGLTYGFGFARSADTQKVVSAAQDITGGGYPVYGIGQIAGDLKSLVPAGDVTAAGRPDSVGTYGVPVILATGTYLNNIPPTIDASRVSGFVFTSQGSGSTFGKFAAPTSILINDTNHCLSCPPPPTPPSSLAFNNVGGGSNASGLLDANGNWVFKIQISNSGPVPNLPTGSKLAAELGFTASNMLLGASNPSTLGSGAGFDTANPGTAIFGWETVDPTTSKPTGLQSNCAAGCTTTGTANQVFSALGSQAFTTVGPHDYILITTKGPTSSALTSSLTVSGKYGTSNAFGRITESVGAANETNYDTFNNVFTYTALDGDTNLDGKRNAMDAGPFLQGYAARTGKWFNGDFTGDGLVNGFDTGHLLLGVAGGPAGSGSDLSSSAVPEPASIAFFGLALLGGIGGVRRHNVK